MKNLIAQTLLIAATLTTAQAASVLVNFGGNNGANGTTVDGWFNQAAQTSGGTISISGLTASNGRTGFSVNITGGGNFFDNPSNLSGNISFQTGTFDGHAGTALTEMQTTLGLTGPISGNVWRNGLYNGGFTDHSLTISGFNAGERVTLYYIAGDNRTDAVRGGIQLRAGFSDANTVTASYITSTEANAGLAGSYTIAGSPTNSIAMQANHIGLVKMEDLVADQDGRIILDLRGGRSGINALAFTVIPEPSAALLGGLGLIGLLRRRRS